MYREGVTRGGNSSPAEVLELVVASIDSYDVLDFDSLAGDIAVWDD